MTHRMKADEKQIAKCTEDKVRYVPYKIAADKQKFTSLKDNQIGSYSSDNWEQCEWTL